MNKLIRSRAVQSLITPSLRHTLSSSIRCYHTSDIQLQPPNSTQCNSTNNHTSNSRSHDTMDQPQPSKIQKSSVRLTVNNTSGALNDILKHFWKYDINITRIESRPNKSDNMKYDIYVDFDGSLESAPGKQLYQQLQSNSTQVQILQSKRVAWYPRRLNELDLVASQVLDAGTELQSDHPGFNDKQYRARRQELADISASYRQGDRIPHITYTQNELTTWGIIYNKLTPLLHKYACSEYLTLFPLLQQNCGYSPDNIPQLQDISDFLKDTTGFQVRPVTGLLSARNFLYGLAHRTFFSTQYLRHHDRPLYTPEPDLIHVCIVVYIMIYMMVAHIHNIVILTYY